MDETDDMEYVKKLISEIVESHQGERKAITGPRLLGQLNSMSKSARALIPNTRTLLDVIHDMRREGRVIGSSAHGYFKPIDAIEAHEYVNRVLVSRRNDLSETITAQEKGIVNTYGQQIPMSFPK